MSIGCVDEKTDYNYNYMSSSEDMEEGDGGDTATKDLVRTGISQC